MARTAILGEAGAKAVRLAVAKLFERARARFLGRAWGPKQVVFTSGPHPRDDLTLGGVYDAAARAGGFQPAEQARHALHRVVSGYLDAYEKLAQARAVQAVETSLRDAGRQGVETDLETTLGGHLATVMGQATRDVKRLAETETTRARNAGTLDGVAKVAALVGVKDPVVYFVVVRDNLLCAECARVHLLPDGVTPRVWRMSEVAHGYHVRGEDRPSVAGLHPNCRCSLVSLLPGYGFEGGRVTFVALGHDELARQRG